MKRFTKFATALSTAFLMAAVLATGASAHDNGAAQTPPMGWSSWNLFAANIDEDLIVDIADAMVEYNLDDAGYEYVNLDDNWQSSERDVNGRLQFDPIRFPHDGNWLSNEIHDRGLKMACIRPTACTPARICRPPSPGAERRDELCKLGDRLLQV